MFAQHFLFHSKTSDLFLGQSNIYFAFPVQIIKDLFHGFYTELVLKVNRGFSSPNVPVFLFLTLKEGRQCSDKFVVTIYIFI